MSDNEDARTPTRESILNYVESFIEKRDQQIGDDREEAYRPRGIDRNTVVINRSADVHDRIKLDSRTSTSTDIDAEEFNLESDPVVETREDDPRTYRQQVYLRQYQPPTPDPIDIQVQEVIIKPQVRRSPIHVHVGVNSRRDERRTPSPILIKSAPPPPPPTVDEPIVYNKYVPVEYKQPAQQIIIHRYAELPPKPRPIVVEQWLPNKPAPRRITYRHVDPDEFVQNEVKRQRNRFIEYTKPHTTIEVELVRLPVIRLTPEEYRKKSPELTRLSEVRSITQDPNSLQWRI